MGFYSERKESLPGAFAQRILNRPADFSSYVPLSCFEICFPDEKNIFGYIFGRTQSRRTKGTREQPLWDEHAAFIDRLVSDGVIFMGGPLVDEGGSLLFLNAEDENEVRETMKDDPWFKHGILKLENVKRWQ